VTADAEAALVLFYETLAAALAPTGAPWPEDEPQSVPASPDAATGRVALSAQED
jgi:hypothetical protein